jgi:hypothetical protein
VPASYARDVFVPLVVLGASLSIAFVVLTPYRRHRPVRGLPDHPIDADADRRRVPQRRRVAERRRS